MMVSKSNIQSPIEWQAISVLEKLKYMYIKETINITETHNLISGSHAHDLRVIKQDEISSPILYLDYRRITDITTRKIHLAHLS